MFIFCRSNFTYLDPTQNHSLLAFWHIPCTPYTSWWNITPISTHPIPIPTIQFPYSIPSTCSIRARARTLRPLLRPIPGQGRRLKTWLTAALVSNLHQLSLSLPPALPLCNCWSKFKTMLVQTIMRMISLQTARGGRPRFSHSRISRPAHSTLQVIAVCSQYIAMQQIVHCPHAALLLVFRYICGLIALLHCAMVFQHQHYYAPEGHSLTSSGNPGRWVGLWALWWQAGCWVVGVISGMTWNLVTPRSGWFVWSSNSTQLLIQLCMWWQMT